MGSRYRNYEKLSVDVLIIGAGAAGLRAAIELVQNGISCLVVGKRSHGDAHTRMAAGGINAAIGSLDPEDSWEIHAADTIREGHHICQPKAVELLAWEAPERIRELAEWGCQFSRTKEGKVNHRYFGAQTYRRTCFAGDTTGESILKTVVEKAKALNIPFMLLAAVAVLRGALLRTESRGAHCRDDTPEVDHSWEKSILYAQTEERKMRLTTEPVPPVSSEIQAILDKGEELDYHQLE
ncbi:MAG: FAD-dependent oxidoreductase [Opitutales bacterium]